MMSAQRPVAVVEKRPRRSPAEIEESLEQLSRWMDGLFRIPGTDWRFGLDALVGLIPGAGDTATTLVGFYVLAAGVRYRVPKVTLVRMGLNIAIDYVFGAIPFVGDLFDAAWKSNTKNLELLRRRATVSAAEASRGRTSDWLFVFLIMGVLMLLLVGSLAVSFTILSWIVRNPPVIFCEASGRQPNSSERCSSLKEYRSNDRLKVDG